MLGYCLVWSNVKLEDPVLYLQVKLLLSCRSHHLGGRVFGQRRFGDGMDGCLPCDLIPTSPSHHARELWL
eukprot:3233634-Rhodomonas_salina.1